MMRQYSFNQTTCTPRQSHLEAPLTAANYRFERFYWPSCFESFRTLRGFGQRSVSLDNRKWDSSQHSVFRNIETFYNPVRLHQTLNYLSPDHSEQKLNVPLRNLIPLASSSHGLMQVIEMQFLLTLRATKLRLWWVGNTYAYLSRVEQKFHIVHSPRFLKSKNPLVKLAVLHRRSPLPRILTEPMENPDGPILLRWPDVVFITADELLKRTEASSCSPR